LSYPSRVRSSIILAATVLFTVCCAEEVSISQAGGPAVPVTLANGDTMVSPDIAYTEEAVGGGRLQDPLPMVIALHGKLSRPEEITQPLEGLRTPARLIAPRGAPFGSGFVWWDLHLKNGDPRAFSAAADEAARRIAAFVRRIVREKPTLGKPVIVGFSQGACVTYTLVVKDPDLMNTAFPLSGFLPVGLEPAAWPPGVAKPTIHAFHGLRDEIVPLALGRDSVARMTALGVPTTLEEFPLLPHGVGPREVAALLPEVDDALRRETAAPAR
jgi:phospholipase/carboxylesterase